MKIKTLASTKIKKTQGKALVSPKKRIRKLGHAPRAISIEKRLILNLSQMVTPLSVGGKVQAYESIAAELSALAGLKNGHVWSWNYIASVHSGALAPSKKFIRVVDLYIKKVNPRTKQWFYFAHHRSVVALYDKTILTEIIRTHMQAMGFRPVSFSRYLVVKRLATKKKVYNKKRGK